MLQILLESLVLEERLPRLVRDLAESARGPEAGVHYLLYLVQKVLVHQELHLFASADTLDVTLH